jgi:hypothetical protein
MENRLMRVEQIAVVVLMLITATVLTASASAQSLSSTMGKIKGTVTDPKGAVIPNAIVIIESRQTTQKVVANEEGAYEIELPAGLYRISSVVPAYYPFRRASFCVQPLILMTINIAPVLRILTIGLEVTSSGSRQPITTSPSPKYESFSPPHSSGAPLDLLVRFRKRRQHRDNIEYSEAMASYNALTFYADKMRLDRKTLQLEADGNVVVEDGKQRWRVKRAELEFKAGEPIFKLMQ